MILDQKYYLYSVSPQKALGSTVDRYFIGMKEQSGREGGYYWVDGSPMDFTFWATGQPNDQGGSQQCVIMDPLGKIEK